MSRLAAEPWTVRLPPDPICRRCTAPLAYEGTVAEDGSDAWTCWCCGHLAWSYQGRWLTPDPHPREYHGKHIGRYTR